ncbi:MAG: hypothetical protein N2663_08495, partial [Chlorobi bacterium]|nr:hypothetical protein [Chlorobiota bacterium]
VITSIDYDHQEWLGNTLEQIALEKAGIFKPNVPAVVGETRDRLKPVFSSHAHSVGVSRLIFLDDQDWIYSINSRSTHGMTLSIRLRGWSFDNLFVPLHGEHQVRNLAIALLALQEHWGTIPPADTLPIIERGLRNLRRNSGLRGRIETVRTNPLLVVDVAHNEAGCQALVKTIGEAPFPPKWNVVFGVMRDKDYREMLAVLSRIAIRFFFATPRNPRACSAEELAEQASSFGIPIAVHSNIGEAFLAALQLGEPVVCTGSFFTIEEVLDKLDELGDNVSNSHS